MSYSACSTVEFSRSTKVSFLKADDDWSRELFNCFGNNASDARYTKLGRGEPGSRLRELHNARDAAQKAWADAYGLNS